MLLFVPLKGVNSMHSTALHNGHPGVRRRRKTLRQILFEILKKKDGRKRQAEVVLFLKWVKDGVEQAGQHSSESISDMKKNEKEEDKEDKEEEEEEEIEEATLGVEQSSRVEEHEMYGVRRKGNKRRRVTLKPKPKVLEEDDGWSTDSDGSISTSLLEAMTKGAKGFFENLSRLEVQAEESSVELAEALAGANQE
jgi:hypothetical protein